MTWRQEKIELALLSRRVEHYLSSKVAIVKCSRYVLISRGGVESLQYTEVDQRLDRMIEIADETGLTLDAVVAAIGRVDQKTFRAFSERPSSLPRYIASRVRP